MQLTSSLQIKLKIINNQNICLGAYILENKTNKVFTIKANNTIIATGGASKVYLYTTNPDVSTGDGLAMGMEGWLPGCKYGICSISSNLPIPFKRYIISYLRSLRGEGGKLTLPNGENFMQHYDDRGDLAPRDIVARAIDFEMKKRGLDCVYLDISAKPKSFYKETFSNDL